MDGDGPSLISCFSSFAAGARTVYQSLREGGGRLGAFGSVALVDVYLCDWMTGSFEFLDFLPEIVIERSVPLPMRL